MLNVNADDSFPDSNAETSAVASVSPSLLKTHTGLSLVYRGMIVSFALGLLALVTPFLLYSGLVSSRFFLGILGSVAAVTWLMLFTGAYLCLAVPQEFGTRPALVTSMALNILMVFCSGYVQHIVPFRYETPMMCVDLGLGVFSAMFFVAFLKRLAAHIEGDQLEARAGMLLRWMQVLGILLLLVIMGAFARIGFVGVLNLPILIILAFILRPILALVRGVRDGLGTIPGVP